VAVSLTVGERILFHLLQYTKYLDSFDVPIDITQDGIAAALRISRAHAALELKKLKNADEVKERLSHIKRGRTKRKAYFLTVTGEARARKIKMHAEENGIDLTPYQDIRRCKGPELWSVLDDKFKPVVAMSCVFRKPFRREVLPDIATSLLPVDERGMVDLPKELKEYVLSVTDPEKVRDYHSFAADYWLHWDDLKEVVYHLVCARRHADAEVLVFNHANELLLSPDESLLEAVSNIRDVSKGYIGTLHYVQAETARRVGKHEYCLIICKTMEASSIPSERFDGYMIEGLNYMDLQEWELAYSAFIRARNVFDERVDVALECNIAEVLIRNNDFHEPKEILQRLLQRRIENPEHESRAYFLLGIIAIRTGEDDEALRMFQLSRAAMRSKQVELLNKVSQMYYANGMRDKSLEFALMASSLKESGTF
jgi:tetratricopeptide (TPR) repeat protein